MHHKHSRGAPNLILTKNLEAEIRVPGPRMEGIVTVERFYGDHKLGLLTGKWQFKNLIVDGGLDLIHVGAGGVTTLVALEYMAVGTDSTAPANGDAALGAELAPAASNRTNANGSIADVHAFGPSFTYASMERTRLFVEAQGNGNLTELGWFTAVSGGTMFSRMLFKDGGGTPTTIVKTASDQLRVTYEIRIYPPVADVVSSIVISGTSYDYTIRPAETDSAWALNSTGGLGSGVVVSTSGSAYETNTLGAQTGIPAGSSVIPTSVTTAAYTNGNFFRDADYIWDPGIANFATGIGAITCYGRSSAVGPMYQIAFHTTKLPKDNTKRLTLTLRHSWSRFP